MAPSDPPPPGTKTYLMSLFENRPRELQSSGWSDLWDTKKEDFWDRGKPSPALIDYLETHEKAPQHNHEDKSDRRPRALVPGCGRGYDVVMLSLHGFDVYGLEVAPGGIVAARKYAEAELTQPHEYNFGDNPPSVLTAVRGDAKIILGDFFKRDWESQLPFAASGGFDLIYDYTFLCALIPEMREDWAKRMSELLSPTGILVCLEFPMYKDLKALGPPWGLNGVHWNLLAEGGKGLLDGSEKKQSVGDDYHELKGKFKRIVYINPPRTFEVGKGTDMLSVWSLKE